MKPLLLRLSGLQSYREVQEVDFERLCEAGVFGIFGPTGSGKSSILDAVTLALYGKVERAANGTQGIMNQAEKTLAVSFTFELSGAGEKKRYRVERQFKRGSGDVSVSNTVSRFVELTEAGDVVLADKLADVTRCVEAQIGLGMQDFTRAVVLPQGKFAEFLSLTGKDRRSMLQRLFRLERFGDGLALKLSQRMKAAEGALNEAAAEQHGLGDASAEAVAAAEARFREAAAAAAAARAALAEAERLHAERLHVRERQTALLAKEAQQAQLLAEAPRVAQLERELARLAAAERLAPALAAAGAAEAALRAAASRREAAGLAHAARLEAATAAAAARTAAAAAAAAGEPRLAQRLEQLAQAERLETDAAALAESVAAGELRARDAEARSRSCGELAAKAQELLGRATAKQAELRKELKAVELTAEDRDKRGALAKRLQQYNHLAAQAEAAQQELSASEEQQARAKQRLEAAEAEQRQAEGELRVQLRELTPVLASLEDMNRELRGISGSLPRWQERVRGELREQQRMQLAEQLAEGLVQGEPCPVCGSCVHPGKHGAAGNALDAGETVLAAWERAIQQAQQLQLSLSPLQAKASSALERLTDAIGSNDEAPDDSKAMQLEFDLFEAAAGAEAGMMLAAEAVSPPESFAMPEAAAGAEAGTRPAEESASTAEALAQHESALVAISEMASLHESWLAQAEKGFASCRNRYAEAARRREQAANEHRTQMALAGRASAQFEQSSAALKQEEALWQEQFGAELKPAQGSGLLLELERREADAMELRGRLEKSVGYIEEQTSAQQESTSEAQSAQLEYASLSATLGEKRQQLDEKLGQLQAITDGAPAAALKAAAEQEISLLRATLITLTEQHDAAQLALSEAAQARSAAEEAENAATQRHREASTEWQAVLAASPFESGEEVAELQPLLIHQTQMSEQIVKYREAEQQLAAQIELLRDQLQGRSLTDEEWEAAVTLLEQARAANESMLQASAKAERDRDELSAKQERWNSLEAKRLDMEQLCGRLKSLQTVFRGNAFVEYVAEEQLVQVCRAASERLGFLTKRRYALEVDSSGGFVIRDDANGGIRRPVSTLSGGETFLASLALALALSGQIQLRGKYPLQFFFLDEGFGTLDPELLDTVITALEKLHNETLAVGVISHVPELRARLPRRLIVTPAEPSGRGSRVELETM
ncbi:AAA family ATPase [Paenibacillus montanisoli]|uniref:Nuclease SbcCD subunit C n=1 Tax=Paenibacillus montanisoli TaxID=2081970 RepID=A0A328U1P0_9BACL|nr:AAA family ATPase [Paenibacillus montanisoli]RAP76718.1 SMC family ATPase [Paenibacillus montanisoli]